MWAPITTALVATSLTVSASAESLILQKNGYEPTVSTQQGWIEMCGIQFTSIVTTPRQEILGISGSLNVSYFRGRVPGLMIKVTLQKMAQGKWVPVPVSHASMRVEGLDTGGLMQRQGDAKNARLLIGDLINHEKMVVDFPHRFHEGPWVSVSVDPTLSDLNYRLPPFSGADTETDRQFTACNADALKAWSAQKQ